MISKKDTIYIAIDIGNSYIKALIQNEQNSFKIASDKWDEIKQQIVSYTKKNYSIIISDVKETLKDLPFEKEKVLFLNSNTPLPIGNQYLTPHTLGYDRIAAAVGAYAMFPNTPCLIIDAGTAITIDLLVHNTFQGGAISPGIKLRYEALHQFTSKLPYLEKIEHFTYPGKNTEDSIHNGVLNGVVFEIEKHIELFLAQFNNGKIIITGGDSLYLVKFIKKTIFAEPNLVLKGLINILEYNAI